MLRQGALSLVIDNEALINEEAFNGFLKDQCILCEKKIENQDKHIKDKTHISKLIQPEIIKFGLNKIVSRKVGDNKVHCLTCNMLFPINTISEHVNKQQHKGLYQKCVSEYNLSKQNKQSTLSNDKQTMSVNMKKSQDEVLNFFSNIEFIRTQGTDKLCTLCDWRFAPHQVEAHVNDIHHNILLHMHNKWIIEMEKELQPKDSKEPLKPDTDKNKDKILDCLHKLQKDGFVIHFERELAHCKKCNVTVDFSYEIIKKHIEEHKKQPQKCAITDGSKSHSNPENNNAQILDCVTTLQVDGMIINFERQLAHCKKCNVTVDFVYETIVQHTEKHKQNERKPAQLPSATVTHNETNKDMKNSPVINGFSTDDNKFPNKEYFVVDDGNGTEVRTKYQFIKFVSEVVTSYSKYVVVNLQYYIHEYSFLVMTKSDTGNTKCQICLETLTKEQENTHKDKHITEIMKIPIITYTVTKDPEFVRQLKSGVFHCGYCNLVKETWEELVTHLTSEEHAEVRLAALWRLHLNVGKVFKLYQS